MLELNPFYVYRDYHSLFREQNSFNFYREARDKDMSVIHPHFGASPIYVLCPGASFQPRVVWYKNYLYNKETERGLVDTEDACSVGRVFTQVEAG
jgi:polyphosphate kinase